MTQSIRPAFNVFSDIDGTLLQNGYIYVGAPDENPETNPVNLYWDSALTQPASQPLKTINGVIVRNGTPSNVFTASDFSMTVKNKKLIIISSIASYANQGSVTGYAAAGVNGDITELTALTTPLTPAQGGSQAYYCGAVVGGPNAIIATPAIPATGFALTAGIRAYCVIASANTGPATLNVGSTIAQNIQIAGVSGLVALVGGELQPNMVAEFEYTAAATWQLLNPDVQGMALALNNIISATFNGSFNVKEQPLTVNTGVVAWDMSQGPDAFVTSAVNLTFAAPTNIPASGRGRLRMSNSSGAPITIAYNGVFSALPNTGDALVTSLPPGITYFEYWVSSGVIYLKHTSLNKFISNAAAMPATTSITTVAHGLGLAPNSAQLILVCISADFGYAVGERVFVNTQDYANGTFDQTSTMISADATNVYITKTNSSWSVTNKSSVGTTVAITTAKWNYIVTAQL